MHIQILRINLHTRSVKLYEEYSSDFILDALAIHVNLPEWGRGFWRAYSFKSFCNRKSFMLEVDI